MLTNGLSLSGLCAIAATLGLTLYSRKSWAPPNRAAPYLPHIVTAEQRYDLPRNVLARLLDQESAYRDDIINGKIISSAGAIGIAQIIPKWHPNVNPLDPVASIYYAAKYLSDLHARYNDWYLTLMAYNWGPGNVDNWRRGEKTMPDETRNYARDILGDIDWVAA